LKNITATHAQKSPLDNQTAPIATQKPAKIAKKRKNGQPLCSQFFTESLIPTQQTKALASKNPTPPL
jgi:hypothetical protein